jgi:hypothetical protein
MKKVEFLADGITPKLFVKRQNYDFMSADKNCVLTPIDYKAHTECKKQGYELDSTYGALTVTTAQNKFACQQNCKNQALCHSFTFYGASNECKLYSKLFEEAGDRLTADAHDASIFSASVECDLKKVSLDDVMLGHDGITYEYEDTSGTYKVSTYDNPIQHEVGKDRTAHTIETLDRTIYKSDAPTPAPTAAPTMWFNHPDNYWIPCTAASWKSWSVCTATCGDGGIQKQQRTITVAHRNPKFVSLDPDFDESTMPPAPVCTLPTEYKCGPQSNKCKGENALPKGTPFDPVLGAYPARMYANEPGAWDGLTRLGSHDNTWAQDGSLDLDDLPATFWVTRFRPCRRDDGTKLPPCPASCEWGEWGIWKVKSGLGSVTRPQLYRKRTIAIKEQNGGNSCMKQDGTECADADCVDEQTKFWDEEKHTYEVTSKPNFVCKPGYEMKPWNTTCVAGVNTREVTETICRNKFLKLKQGQVNAGIAANKQCIKNFRPSDQFAFWQQRDTKVSVDKHGDRIPWYKGLKKPSPRQCQLSLAKFASEKFKYAVFRPINKKQGWGFSKKNCYLVRGDFYQGEVFVRNWAAGYGSHWTTQANWKTFQTSCDLTSNFGQTKGTNPARVVMKYKQTRTCTDDNTHTTTHYANVFRVSKGVQTEADQQVTAQESPLGLRVRGRMSSDQQRSQL